MWLVIVVIVIVVIGYILYSNPALRYEIEHAVSHIPGKAVAIFDDEVKGTIEFNEVADGGTRIHVKLTGVPQGERGLHIHEYGDVKNPGKHFNPTDVTHGDVDSGHVGDLGNVEANSRGEIDKVILSKNISLHGRHSVVGRSIVLHTSRDDLGTTDHPNSKVNGNSGSRIAVAMIGIASP